MARRVTLERAWFSTNETGRLKTAQGLDLSAWPD